MSYKKIIENIRTFVDQEVQKGNKLTISKRNSTPSNYFKKIDIKVDLDKCKDIILQEETKIELGGEGFKSFSIVYPISDFEYVKDGEIILIGPEIEDITDRNLDFGMFILIGGTKISEKDKDNMRRFNFLSNGIEGFMIRTIPRRFWCRISDDIIKKNFSFEFLGNAIMYLYKQKFKDLIESIEIIFINSNPNTIQEFIDITSEIREQISAKWKKKIEDWKKRIDCEYDWACEICPYQEDCFKIKETLVERDILDEREMA